MRVMLTKDVERVGKAGDIKEVADGYGRNYLLPRKLAVPAHSGVEAEGKRLREAAARREAKERTEAQALADEIGTAPAAPVAVRDRSPGFDIRGRCVARDRRRAERQKITGSRWG